MYINTYEALYAIIKSYGRDGDWVTQENLFEIFRRRDAAFIAICERVPDIFPDVKWCDSDKGRLFMYDPQRKISLV